jgi:hypothetical protein
MKKDNFIEGFTDAYFKLIGGRSPCIFITGNPFYEKLDFLNLKPEDKINQVGDKVSGSAAINRIDMYKTFITYKGVLKTKLMTDDTDKILEVLIFSINTEEGVEDIPHNQYLGYIVLRHEEGIELKVPDIQTNTNRIYQPVFKKITK